MTFASFVANTLVGLAEVIREDDRRSVSSKPRSNPAQAEELDWDWPEDEPDCRFCGGPCCVD